MPGVDFTAVPSGAAITTAVATDGRAATAPGFAAALATAQAAVPAGDGDVPGDDVGDATAGEPSTGRGKADAQLAAWLAMSRLAQQLTGVAVLGSETPLIRKPAPEPTDPVSGGEAPRTSEGEAAIDAALLLAPVLALTMQVAPEVARGEGQAMPFTPEAPRAEPFETAAEALIPEEPLLEQVAVESPQTSVTVPSPESDGGPSIKELLAELSTAVTHRPQAATPSAEGTASTEVDPRSAGSASVPQTEATGKGQSDGRRGAGQGSRHGRSIEAFPAEMKTAAAPTGELARAMAARFQVHEDATPATRTAGGGGSRLADTAEWPRPAGRVGQESVATAMFTGLPLASSTVGAAGRVVGLEAMTPTPSLSHETAAELQTQIVQAIRVQAFGSGGDARIRLQPEYLGELSVSLSVENGSVTARLAASSADVRQWVEANEPLLRQSLAQQDLRLEKLVVVEEEPSTPGRDAEAQQDRQREAPRQRRRQTQADATFEVVV